MRVTELLRESADRLARAGVASPRVDAELITAHVLDVARGKLILLDEIDEDRVASVRRLTELRAGRVPLQHVTGVAPFLSLELKVGPGVFIPRPETELLARWGIEVLADVDAPVVVDLCSGTGALALAVAVRYPAARVYAVERSPAALRWLRTNTADSAVEVVAGDIRDTPLPKNVDLVLSNPPYVPSGVPVPPEVRVDPEEAVFAGPDGLELIPAVIQRAAQILRPGGRLGFEHDETHTGLADLLRPHFDGVESHRDLAGRPRFTTAVRRA